MATADQTAVLFIECQRGVVGDMSTLPALAEAARPALAAMGRLAKGARQAGVPVFHLLYKPLLNGRSYNTRAPMFRITKRSGAWTADHPALQVAEEIGVGPDDIVMSRAQGISPVYRTEVLTILKNMRVEEVVVAGVSTNWAIPLTVAGVADEDMTPVIPTDAAVGVPASHHQSMIDNALGFVAKLTTVDDVLAGWGAV